MDHISFQSGINQIWKEGGEEKAKIKVSSDLSQTRTKVWMMTLKPLISYNKLLSWISNKFVLRWNSLVAAIWIAQRYCHPVSSFFARRGCDPAACRASQKLQLALVTRRKQLMPRLEMLETAADCAENNWTKWGNRAERTWIYVFIAQNLRRYNLQVANQFPETDKSHQHVISATNNVGSSDGFIEMSLFSLSLSSMRLDKSGTFTDHWQFWKAMVK